MTIAKPNERDQSLGFARDRVKAADVAGLLASTVQTIAAAKVIA